MLVLSDVKRRFRAGGWSHRSFQGRKIDVASNALEPTSGQIIFDGMDITSLRSSEFLSRWNAVRYGEVAYIVVLIIAT